ncbi:MULTISPECIES: HAD family phosphatase [unclassified Streptomyces]|uniref:HAD family hydrolase n=1 Tax=unclassified Streptomyces TaxID=2593676 RepID=UPI002E80C435|nr:HAD family phosphatase [Streptomyces sp. NBC_00589]WTI41108.1 HAD family phosphatase [Streptomyces sp. NBC_00775]WUB25208.1 HAD family phosphatase [Streptomyces sp. NBC_00589]
MSTLGGISVIFDLDGTLVDSEPNYFEAGRQTLAGQGITDFTWADHERYVGISTQETLALWKERYGLSAPLDTLLAEKNRRYLELARAATQVYPEMRKFVELLAAEGVPMAVASGSSPEAIEAILAGSGLASHLTTVVSADEVAHGKPAPDVFLEAARRLGAAPADCVVMEDAAPGAAAAHAAGMRCIAIPYVAAHADDPAFATAGLLLRGGQADFTARSAYDWLAESAPAS